MRKEDFRVITVIAMCYLLLELLGVTCPILYITGVSCAGCGMSRAWQSLLRLDFAAALAYHPLFWLPVPMAALVLLRRRLPERAYRWGMGGICALFLLVYLYRMIFLDDPVVVFHPGSGLVGRGVSNLLGIGR